MGGAGAAAGWAPSPTHLVRPAPQNAHVPHPSPNPNPGPSPSPTPTSTHPNLQRKLWDQLQEQLLEAQRRFCRELQSRDATIAELRRELQLARPSAVAAAAAAADAAEPPAMDPPPAPPPRLPVLAPVAQPARWLAEMIWQRQQHGGAGTAAVAEATANAAVPPPEAELPRPGQLQPASQPEPASPASSGLGLSFSMWAQPLAPPSQPFLPPPQQQQYSGKPCDSEGAEIQAEAASAAAHKAEISVLQPGSGRKRPRLPST